jgi:hypothetical protein
MRFEVRIPISPRPHFFTRVKLIARSLRACGGMTAGARVVVSVGEDCEPYDLEADQPWSKGVVQWRWVDRQEFRKLSFHATGLDRMRASSDADVVLCLDADTIFIRGVDDLLAAIAENPVVAGMIAFRPPFSQAPKFNQGWRQVFDRFGLQLPSAQYEYSGWRFMYEIHKSRWTPAYYNYAALFVPGAFMSDLAREYEKYLFACDPNMFRLPDVLGQVALTMAIHELNLPRTALSPRYNFPNDPRFEQRYSDDFRDLRILHFLRRTVVDRDRDFASPQAIEALIARSDLKGSNELLRHRIAELKDAGY